MASTNSVCRQAATERLVLGDCVEEVALLRADPLASRQSQLAKHVDRHVRSMVPVVDLGDLGDPGELRHVDPLEIPQHEHRLALPRHDDAVVAVVAGSFVADDIGYVLRSANQQRVEVQRRHAVLDQVVAADELLRRHRQTIVDDHRHEIAVARLAARLLERHVLGMRCDLQDLTVAWQSCIHHHLQAGCCVGDRLSAPSWLSEHRINDRLIAG